MIEPAFRYGFMDSFSGSAAHLPKGRRTAMNVLVELSRFPFVSTWDMSENAWLRNFIDQLKKDGLIEEVPEPYPWHRFRITSAGATELMKDGD